MARDSDARGQADPSSPVLEFQASLAGARGNRRTSNFAHGDLVSTVRREAKRLWPQRQSDVFATPQLPESVAVNAPVPGFELDPES
jgi:hypothetical protein